MNNELLKALLQYFRPDEWRKSKNLRHTPPFDEWGYFPVQDHILALTKLGILEKRKNTATTNALYRINVEAAQWWVNELQVCLTRIPKAEMKFRTLYIFYVIGLFYLEHNRPPRQIELYYSDRPGHHGGLINTWLNESGAKAEDPGIAGPPHIRAATQQLAQLGYLVERGGKNNPQPFLPTDKGVELIKYLKTLHWRDWPVLEE